MIISRSRSEGIAFIPPRATGGWGGWESGEGVSPALALSSIQPRLLNRNSEISLTRLHFKYYGITTSRTKFMF